MPDPDTTAHTESVPEDAIEIEQLDDVSGGGLAGIDSGHHQEQASKLTN